jgi:hypothetical protein
MPINSKAIPVHEYSKQYMQLNMFLTIYVVFELTIFRLLKGFLLIVLCRKPVTWVPQTDLDILDIQVSNEGGYRSLIHCHCFAVFCIKHFAVGEMCIALQMEQW